MFTKKTKTLKEIGQTLKVLRESKGLTQKEVAIHINISKSCVCRIEKGMIKELDILLTARYVSVFNLSLDELVFTMAA